MNQEKSVFGSNENEETSISLVNVVEKYLVHWRWILVSILFCILIGWLYGRYTTPRYESVATVLIEEENTNAASDELGMLQDLGLTSGGGVLEDEMELYKSRSIMERVVRDLRLNWKYEGLGTKTGFVRSELYDNCPVRIRSVSADSTFFNKKYEFNIILNSTESYTVLEGAGLVNSSFKYGVVVNSPIGKFIVEKSPEFFDGGVGKSIRISLLPVDLVAGNLRKHLTVEAVSKDANMLVLKIKGHNAQKNNAILNRLIAVHQENAISNKNAVVQNTTAFINERMKFIAAELTDVEKQGESYKSEHHLVDVTSDAAAYLGKEGEIEKKVVETSIEMNLAEFMNKVISEQNGYEQLLPANLGFKDPSVTQMTTQYNTLVLERNRLRETSGEKHPGVARIESQLASLRGSLETSLRNMRNSSQMQLNKLKGEEAIYQSKISDIPMFEREYRDILRQQQIKESLYLFLLQKREQNEISLAATVANTRIIDAAYSSGVPVSPKKSVIYLIAFFLGLIIPISVIYVKDLFNNKIKSSADFEKTGLTVLGEIPETKKTDELLIPNYPQSGIAESFRALRANLSFIFPKTRTDGKVISVTSSIGGEGKSSSSVNLAFIYAASGKKVMLIVTDLRKPKVHDILDIKSKYGLSNYLANTELTADDIVIERTIGSYSIDVITAGDIPPNPSELLMSERFDELIGELRKTYDYVIFDNAPVGLVADALTTNRFADVTLYLVRSGFVDKSFLQQIADMHKKKKLSNMYILINAVSKQNTSYTYGYGEAFEKKKWWKRMLFFK